MVLEVEQSSPLQGALIMASRSEEDDRTNCSSVEESSSQHVLQNEGALSCYTCQPVYCPHVSSNSFWVFPYSYTICATVVPKENFLDNICHRGTSHQDVSLGENYPLRNGAFCATSNVGEPHCAPTVVESRINHSKQFNFTFLSLRERSNCGQQSPSHPSQVITWILDFPKEFCGRLIGKKGKNLRKLMHDTNTHLSICKDEENERKQILTIYGLESQILDVVSMIEEMFAERGSVPGLRNSRALPIVHPKNSTVIARQMELPIDMEVNVMISAVVNAGHFYLIMPRFDAVAFKTDLERLINNFYDSGHTPKLSLTSTLVGTYCVGNLDDKWFRVQIVGIFATAGKVEVLLLDYGHFAIIPFSSLRRMRADFLDVPFQAIECCLSNVVPRGGKAKTILQWPLKQNVVIPNYWNYYKQNTSLKATIQNNVISTSSLVQIYVQPGNGDYFFSLPGTNVFQRLTEKKKLKVICRGLQSGVSLVDLYSYESNTTSWINQRLVELGVANWNEVAV